MASGLFSKSGYRIIYKVFKMKKKFLIITLFLFGIIAIPIFSYAQPEIMLQQNDVEIETIPQSPEPYQDVTINLVSYATDLNKAMIKWESGSKTILSGYGKTSYSFTTSGPNTTTVFNVIITPPNSLISIIKKVLISPSEVTLLWEAVGSYSPPFYKGKSFVSRQGSIKVVAIPTTNDIIQSGSNNITYTWKLNDNAVQDASGYNKNSYVFQNSILDKTENVSVLASSVDGKYNASKTITIPTVSPEMIFYKKSPTEGILYNKALLNEALMTKDEMTIVAEPYFLDLKGNEDNFSYLWKINGKKINTPINKRELTVKPSSRGGYATISFTMENLSTLFQSVSGQLKLNL